MEYEGRKAKRWGQKNKAALYLFAPIFLPLKTHASVTLIK